MAITSGYFNSVNGDRKYNADQMSEYFEGIINEGVCQHIGGGLAVTAGTGLTVSVATGKAFIGQKWIKNDAALTLTITTAADQARIDAVVLRRNTTNRVCEIAIKTGTPSASPSAPAMTRTSTTYEMALAYVNVAAGATSVTVTDKRADTTVCGWATVAQATSGEVDAQLNALKTGFDGVVYDSPEEMVTSCDQILQTQITNIDARLTPCESDVNNIKYYLDYVPKSENLLDVSAIVKNKYVTAGGNEISSSSYDHTTYIPVDENDVIVLYGLNGAQTAYQPLQMRFVTAYNSNKVAIESAGKSSGVNSYMVPSGISYIIITGASNYLNKPNMVMKNRETVPDLGYIPFYEAHYIARGEFIEKAISEVRTWNEFTVKTEKSSFSNGETMTACKDIDNKKGDKIVFFANVTSFDSISVGHGYNMSYGAYLTIDNTNVTVYYGTTQYYQHAHGLTISGYLKVEIIHTDSARADIKISTLDGDYSIANANAAWGGSKGDVFAKNTNSTLTNAILSCTFSDFDDDVFVFGDSYVGLGDVGRWPYYMIQNDHKRLALFGYGGGTSAAGMLAFQAVLEVVKPKYCVWALGMNDPDSSSAINSSYKTNLDKFLELCGNYAIVPIVATIPNVPERIHTFKNTYVRSLGCRTVEFAKAVGADSSGSSWDTGLLSSDNVHPTARGAIALYSRFICDVPESLK